MYNIWKGNSDGILWCWGWGIRHLSNGTFRLSSNEKILYSKRVIKLARLARKRSKTGQGVIQKAVKMCQTKCKCILDIRRCQTKRLFDITLDVKGLSPEDIKLLNIILQDLIQFDYPLKCSA